MTNLEMTLISSIAGLVGIGIGKYWGSRSKVSMERCTLIHKGIEEKLTKIEEKLDNIYKKNP